MCYIVRVSENVSPTRYIRKYPSKPTETSSLRIVF
jgi:hypothetical protein